MIFWHLGGAILLFRAIYRDPKVDLRFLALGALLPDLIDLPLGTLIFAQRFSSGELYAHTLAFAFCLGAATLLATRRGPARRRWMAVTIGVLMHLLLDGLWTSAAVLFWPLAGTAFPRLPSPYWPGAWERALIDPWRWVEEAAGLAYLGVIRLRSGVRIWRSIDGQGSRL